jgi:D-alanine transaminase
MKTVGYYNGQIDEIDAMRVPMNDRAMYFGDGVYDATYAANRKIFEIDYHLDRFYNSFTALKMPFRLTREELKTELQKCIDKMDSNGVVFVYWQCTRGTGPRNHLFPTDGKPANLLIFIREAKLTDLRRPFRVLTEEDTRFLHCNIKTLNLIPNVMAAQKALEAGCDEVIFHRGTRVTECAHCNVHILKNGEFRTAPTDNLILPGITRRHVLQICKRMQIPFREEAFTVDDLFTADEVIISSAGTLCVPVCEIDGKKAGGKDPETLRKIQKAAVQDFYTETEYMPDIID